MQRVSSINIVIAARSYSIKEKREREAAIRPYD